MHTNYKELGRRIAGPLVVPFLHAMVATLCAIHCHKVISHCLTTTLVSLDQSCMTVETNAVHLSAPCNSQHMHGGVLWQSSKFKSCVSKKKHRETRC